MAKTIDFTELKNRKVSSENVSADVKVGDETYAIRYRYADGNTLMRGGDMTNTEYVFLILSRCLVDTATDMLAGAEGAKNLIRVAPALANAIAAEISTASVDYLASLDKAKDDAVKNSGATA